MKQDTFAGEIIEMFDDELKSKSKDLEFDFQIELKPKELLLIVGAILFFLLSRK